MNKELDRIKKAVELTAECQATHAETVRVVEVFRDQIMWEGDVEVFALQGHPKAARAYGWQQDTQVTAVLEIPPVDSPNTAVRASIIARKK
jgi:hypothetical protein